MDPLVERLDEVIGELDAVISRRGLRAAQRRSLWDCRRMLHRIRTKMSNASEDEQGHLLESLFAAVARTCELLNAYFCT